MLPRAFRLKRSPLFQKAMASGVILSRNPSFLVLGLKRAFASEKPTMFGFIVSKKVSNKAVVRNKARRRLREIIRKNLSPEILAGVSPYIAVVVIARSGILTVDTGALEAMLLQCLRRHP